MKWRFNVWLWGGGLLGLFLVACAPLIGTLTGTSRNPGLALQISVTKGTFDLKEPINVKVELINKGNEPLRVLKLFLLEDYPIRFDILDEGGKRARFLGPELERDLGGRFHDFEAWRYFSKGDQLAIRHRARRAAL